jgi:teichuronic acid biosynthesis glycosyltransferase TuaG
MTMLFSVIVPFRNAGATLVQTLRSLESQTCDAWECCLIDDASQDNSAALAADFVRKDPRFRLFPAQAPLPLGVAASRNKGIAAARGAYIAFLDADDLWLPAKLERQAEAFEAGADIVFSAYQRISSTGRPLGIVPALARVAYRDALSGNPIGCLTGAYRKARFPKARMPIRPLHEDYPFWLSLLKQDVVAVGLPEVLAQYRVSAGSHSAGKLRAMLAVWDILKAEGLPPADRVRGFGGYVLRSLKNRL